LYWTEQLHDIIVVSLHPTVPVIVRIGPIQQVLVKDNGISEKSGFREVCNYDAQKGIITFGGILYLPIVAGYGFLVFGNMNERIIIVMKSECKHIPIETAARLVQERLQTIGFNDIVIEDNDTGFKNFFATGDQVFEEAFSSVQILLYELHWEDGSGAGMEFHAIFFSRKGRKIQRRLSKNEFERLRSFLDKEVFDPAGLKAMEYDPPDPSDRNYNRAKNSKNLFPDQIPGVEIHVGGWLCKGKQT
jgi:hypothetical protein